MLLFLDCETGGLSEDASLLELGMILTTDKFDTVEEKSWKIKPDNGNYVVTAQGLSVNKIDLVSHDKVAKTYKQVATELYHFICYPRNYISCSTKHIPVGKNLSFDLQRIFDHLISKGAWESWVSYQPLELNGAWRLLQLQGKVPFLQKTSLSDIANYFNLNVADLHSGVGDCRLYVEILRRMVQL